MAAKQRKMYKLFILIDSRLCFQIIAPKSIAEYAQYLIQLWVVVVVVVGCVYIDIYILK